VIWARLAPAPLEGGGMPPEAAEVRWEVADDARFLAVVRRGVAIAAPELGHSVHADVTGLELDRWYFYRLIAGGEASPIGRARTFPAVGAAKDRLRFAFAVVGAAHELGGRLQQLGLESFPRTTGGKGLHLVVPTERRHDWVEAKAFAGGIARAMQADSPERYTAVLSKAARRGRIFVVDHLRNDRAATAVAGYSLRGRARAPVAMPLDWAEVTPRLDPPAFTIPTVPALVAGRGDPWAWLPRRRQRLPARAAGKLAA
jgi:PhoD-like phosphatase, N-terminal domain